MKVDVVSRNPESVTSSTCHFHIHTIRVKDRVRVEVMKVLGGVTISYERGTGVPRSSRNPVRDTISPMDRTMVALTKDTTMYLSNSSP